MSNDTFLLILIISAIISFIYFLISGGLYPAIIYGIYASIVIALWAESAGII